MEEPAETCVKTETDLTSVVQRIVQDDQVFEDQNRKESIDLSRCLITPPAASFRK